MVQLTVLQRHHHLTRQLDPHPAAKQIQHPAFATLYYVDSSRNKFRQYE